MLELGHLLIDTNKDVKPSPFYLGGKETGAIVWAVRPGNPAHTAEVARLEKKYESQLKIKVAGSEQLESELAGKAWFRTVVKSWEGIVIKGEEFKYTEENCVKLFADPVFNDLRKIMIEPVINAVDGGVFREVVLSEGQEEESIKK